MKDDWWSKNWFCRLVVSFILVLWLPSRKRQLLLGGCYAVKLHADPFRFSIQGKLIFFENPPHLITHVSSMRTDPELSVPQYILSKKVPVFTIGNKHLSVLGYFFLAAGCLRDCRAVLDTAEPGLPLVRPKSLASWQSGAEIPTNHTISFTFTLSRFWWG